MRKCCFRPRDGPRPAHCRRPCPAPRLPPRHKRRNPRQERGVQGGPACPAGRRGPAADRFLYLGGSAACRTGGRFRTLFLKGTAPARPARRCHASIRHRRIRGNAPWLTEPCPIPAYPLCPAPPEIPPGSCPVRGQSDGGCRPVYPLYPARMTLSPSGFRGPRRGTLRGRGGCREGYVRRIRREAPAYRRRFWKRRDPVPGVRRIRPAWESPARPCPPVRGAGQGGGSVGKSYAACIRP